MSDRAEQAKALIDMVDARFAGAERINLTIGERIAVDLAAALTASEAEVTRLETGIDNAMALKEWVEDHGWMVPAIELAQYVTTYEPNDAVAVLTALSQPTNDTNGAHA